MEINLFDWLVIYHDGSAQEYDPKTHHYFKVWFRELMRGRIRDVRTIVRVPR